MSGRRSAQFEEQGNCPYSRTIDEFVSSISTNDLSAEDACKHYLLQIDNLNAKLNAYLSCDQNRVLNAARRIDTTPEWISSNWKLKGVPIAVKDLFDYEGLPTRAGSLATSDQAATSSARVVQELEDAGAVILGKTQSVEFAFGGWGTNPVLGTPWNPWDLDVHRVPGGSSSGSAVSVASGMAMAALGTDTGGSIRTPASYCSLVGVKTSMGLVSRQGVFPLCPTHDTVGTLTRSVRDAATVLQVLCGPDSHDPATLKAPHIDFLCNLDDGVEELRLGVLEVSELAAVDQEVRGLHDAAVQAIRNAGVRTNTFALPRSLMTYLELGGRLMSAESYASLYSLVDRDDSPVAPAIRERVLAGRDITREQYELMLNERLAAQQEFLNKLDNVDALVMPTCPSTAIPVAEVDESTIVTPFGRFVNYLDLAAVSVPMGLAPDGLPAGLQIVVRKYDEAIALQIAQALELSVGTFEPPGF